MVSDPPAVPQGNRAGYTTDGDIAIKVPALHGASYDSVLTPFEAYAESVLLEMQKVLRRLRSQHLSTTVVNDAAGWDLTKQKTRIVGEVWGYGEYDFTRTGGTIEVPANGNLPSEDLGTITDDQYVPRSLARLFTVNTGRLAAAYVLADGSIKLAAMNSGLDIHTGDVLTFAGMWPLLNGYDSEA